MQGRKTRRQAQVPAAVSDSEIVSGLVAEQRSHSESHRIPTIALRRPAESIYHEIFDKSPVGIVIASGESIALANQRVVALSGYSRDELMSQPYMDLIHSDDRNHIRDVRMQLLEGNRDHATFEFRMLHKDGGIRWFEGSAVPIMYAGRIATLNYLRDISAKKELHIELKDSEARYRSFVENFQGIAFRYTRDFVPLFYHGAVEAITGYSERELLSGHPQWSQIVYRPDREMLTRQAQQVQTVAGISLEREYRIQTRDNEIKWIRESIQNIPDDNGSPMYIQGAIYDITEKKRSEQKLRQTYANLEQEREILNQKNQTLKDVLNQIQEEKKQLALDIQSNLNRITLPLFTMLEEQSDPDKKEYIAIIREAIGNITSPYLSRLEQLYSQLTQREVEICMMIRSGFTSKQIAQALNNSEQTVRKQRKMIRRKLGIANTDVNLMSFLKLLR